MHKVKRAIIMAAGTGERLRPVTLRVPKPLIEVNGVRMIDTIIHGLRANGISEIHVVVGYLKEQFADLREKYPEVSLIENPYYGICNNIASLYVARDYIEDAIILDGDQIINNVDVLAVDFGYSGYNAAWTENDTKEWLMTVENGIVTGCSRTGGNRGWQLFGVSRWSAEDGKKLKRHLEMEFEEKRNCQIYWDDIPMFCHASEYHLGIHEVKFGDIVEIDSLDELIALDKSYVDLALQ
ncbi:MAG: sugar phosphate nucleotidyltransferase [Ruminococcus flavefaciens]|nr:sugar phosphate nucleotidyltransferase [Ruminococcus flavefaciens]